MITIPEDIETVLPREATKLLRKQRNARENMTTTSDVVVYGDELLQSKTWSDSYTYYYTKKEAGTATENIIFNRMAYHRERAEELLERLKEVCTHKSIDGQGKCIRCELRVPK